MAFSPHAERLVAGIRQELEELRRDFRGASAYPTSAPTPANLVRKITQTAHGFAANDTITTEDAGVTWALADCSVVGNVDEDSVLGVVGRVLDDDNVLVVFFGILCIEGLDEFTPYYLDPTSPGGLTTTPPAEEDGTTRLVLTSTSGNLVWVGGAGGGGGSSTLDGLTDVAITTPAARHSIWYDPGSLTWVNRLMALTDLPDMDALSVLANATNATAAPTAVVAATDHQVFKRNGTALEFGLIVTDNITDKHVTYAKVQDVAGLSLVGRAANTTGVAADITAANDFEVMRRDGTSIAFGQIKTGGITDANVTYAKIQDVTALSVVGRAGNTDGVVAPITAGSDHHVLKRSGTSLTFGLVTTSNMDSPIGAGGPTGSASVVPVITYDASGRLTAVTTATITPAAIGAVDSATFAAHSHTLDALSNVTITSKATNDAVLWNGSAWVNRNLGKLEYFTASTSLLLDGGTGGTAANAGMGKSGSRFILGGPSIPLDFIKSGGFTVATDKCARLKISSGNLLFYDEADGSTDGTETMRWTCDSTAGNRRFDFKIAAATNNRFGLKGSSTGDASLHIANNSYVRWFTASPSDSDLVASSPSTAHFRTEYDSAEVVGPTTGALILRHSGDLTTKRISISTGCELMIYYSSTRKITLRLDSFLKLDGSAVSAGASGATLDIRMREMDVCEGGVAKKVMVLASATY